MSSNKNLTLVAPEGGEDAPVATPRMEGQVLVVDDTEAKRYVIVKALRRAGMQVWEASTGEEALAAAALRPDVVVLDVRLPDMSGFEVCRRLKAAPDTAAIPILYLSALLKDEELEARLFEDGADGYIPQPIEPKHLVAQTWALVRMRRAELARLREREEAQAERERFQRELDKQQARARRLTESGMVGILYWDVNGALLEANDTFLALVGYTREDLARGQLDWRKLLPPEGVEEERQRVQTLLARGVGPLEERQLLRADGSRVDVILGSATFPDEPHQGVAMVVDVTARREAERRLTQLMGELESKERLLDAVLQQMPLGVLIAEASSERTLLSNGRMASLLGVKVERGQEALRTLPVEHPEGRPPQPEALPLARALRQGEEVTEEAVIRRDDGSIRLTRMCAAPVRDAEGRIVASVLTLEDITEQKATQESLRSSEERLRLALEAAALGVWMYDSLEDELVWDARTRELFGLPPEAEVDLDRWLKRVHPDDLPRVRDEAERAIAGENGGACRSEYRALGEAGVLRWLSSRGRASVGVDGRVRLVGTVMDITERKLAEQHAEALHATTVAFSHALTPKQVAEAMVEHGLKSLDAHAGVVSQVVGEELVILGSVGYPEPILDDLRRMPLSVPWGPLAVAAHTGQAVWIESFEAFTRQWPELAQRMGKNRSRSWGCIPLRSGGRVVGVLGLSFPTPRRFSQREKAHLEALCRLGAQALERARLYEESRERAELEQQFLGVVSHDLRNPLQAISLGARTLQRMERPAPEVLLRMAGRMANSADMMGKMISDLLDFTRGRLGGGLPLERRPNDLVLVCREVIDEFTVTNPSQDIHLEADARCEGWWDGPRLRQVLSNLLSNALRHARQGTAVCVRARQLPDEVVLSVSNEGTPIPAELLPVLFEPFRRGNATFRPSGSLGLGLYIVHQVVVGHGGTVEVATGEAGTTFTVRLPRA